MKKIFLVPVLMGLFLAGASFARAGYDCDWFGYSDAKYPNYTGGLAQCESTYQSCDTARLANQKAYSECNSKCTDMPRWEYCLTYAQALNHPEDAGCVNFANCVAACDASKAEDVDCVNPLKSCCAAAVQTTTTTTTTTTVTTANTLDNTGCQNKYGNAHADSGSSTGCRCDTGAYATTKNGAIVCEWTQDYLDQDCKSKYGLSVWDASAKACACLEYTELTNGECVGESLEVTQARQELQYAVYRRILEFAVSGFAPAQDAANKLFGIGTDEMSNDRGENNVAYMQKLEMYRGMSEWQGLDTNQAIQKAVDVLKGKKATVGKMNVVIENTNTVYAKITDTIGFLFSGTAKAYDTGSSKTTIFTPGSVNKPAGTIYTVTYDPETKIGTTTVEEGEVEVIDSGSGITTTLSAGESVSTTTSDAIEVDSTSCFTDTAGNQYETAICYVKERGVVQGYNDGTYRPGQVINRAEFTKIIMAATYESGEINGGSCFGDVKGEWFAPYICAAKTRAIVGGNPDGTFRPSNQINLAEALKIILEAAAKQAGYEIPNANGQWYQKYVNLANELGILNTIDSDPTHNLTRGEMAEIIYVSENL